MRTSIGTFAEGHAGYNRTHGMARTSEYNCWLAMRARCYNPNIPSYRNYGARGISVCEEWRLSFDAFFAYVGPKPTPEHSLDRYPDNNGNYEPGNVRWAVQVEQMRNMRRNRWIEFDGRRMLITEWAKEMGLSLQGLRRRLARYPVDVALTMETIPQALVRADRVIPTHCIRGHEFTVENTRPRKGNKRSCRQCDLMWHLEENERRKAARRAAR